MRGRAREALRSIGQKNLTSPRIPRTAHVRAHALLDGKCSRIELIASRVGHSAGHAGNRPPASLMRSISTRCRFRTSPSRSACRCACPLSSQGQALAKARSATSAVDPDGEATVISHGSAPFRRYPKLAVAVV
jgi:hypothetical protein